MTRPLIQVAEVALGRQRSPEHEKGPHLVNYLRSANVSDGKLDMIDVKSMNFNPREQAIFTLRSGDVLVTEGSGSRDTVGASAVWRDELPPPVCYQNTLLRVRPRLGMADGRYLAWWARHAHAAGLMAAVASGANILHLSAEQLRRLPVPNIGLDQQRRIADFLDDQVARIDNIIAARKRQVAELASLSIAYADEALTDPKAPLRRLGSVLAVGAVGVVVNPSSYFVDDGVPFIHGYNVRDGYFDLSDLKRMTAENSIALGRSRLRAGDVLVVRAGYPGRAAVVTDELVGGNCASVLLLRPDKTLLPAWLEAFFNSNLGKHQVALAQYGAAQGVINLDDVRAFPIPVPPIEQQQRRMSRLADRREQISAWRRSLVRSLALLDDLKRSLITSAVTGEFDVLSADGSRVPA